MSGPPGPRADELTFITFGPGFGESSVVHVPPDQWLIVDSLAEPSTGRNPALMYLREIGAQPTRIVLTHPHEDHAAGFDLLVDELAEGFVGWVDDAAAAAGDPLREIDAALVLKRGRGLHAKAAILDRWERVPTSCWRLEMGNQTAMGDARITVLSPHPRTLARARAGAATDINSLSAALLIEWNSVRVVLGADLTGPEWTKVIRDFDGAEPGNHHALKVPHHGSRSSQHAGLAPKDAHVPVWWLTPWNKGGKLPRFAEGEGVDVILRRVNGVVVTSMPFELGSAFVDHEALRADIDAAVARSRFGGDDMLLEYESEPPSPEDAWCLVGLGADGACLRTLRGSSAWVVKP